jgi:hypothetical protein
MGRKKPFYRGGEPMNEPNNKAAILFSEKPFKISLTVLLRIIILLLVFAFAFAFTRWLASLVYFELLARQKFLWPWLSFGSAGVSLAILIKFFDSLWGDLKEVLKSLHITAEGEFNEKFKRLICENYIPLFLLLFAIVVYSNRATDEKEKVIERIINSVQLQAAPYREIVYLAKSTDKIDPEQHNPPDYLARFPIMFDRATLNDAVDIDAKTLAAKDFMSGIQYDPDLNNNFLRKFIDAIEPCGSTDGTKPVIISVEGYASSEPFYIYKTSGTGVRYKTDQQYTYSEKMNLATAEYRGKEVAAQLIKLIGNDKIQQIKVNPAKTWESISDMETVRGFNDRPLGGSENNAQEKKFSQDLFTRAAHIKIIDPGLCDVHIPS